MTRSDSFLYFGKVRRSGGGGKWHLFEDESSERSICGIAEIESLSENLPGLRKFHPDNDSVEEVTGLGGICQKCMEYVRGSLSSHPIPRVNMKAQTRTNLLDDYKRRNTGQGVE